MKGRQIGDKMWEDRWDASLELSMDEANATDTNNTEVWAETKKPVDGDLALNIKLILLDGAIMPDAHYQHKDESQYNRYPGSLPKFDKCSREVQCLNCSKEHNKANCKKYAPMPAQDYHQGHQTCCDQHDSYNSQSCIKNNFVWDGLLFPVNLSIPNVHDNSSSLKKSINTGIPDALPKCFVSLKPMVTAKHSTIRIQLISGMYICPCTLADVWTIFTRGKQPREVHCLIIENVPVMTAWLPTTAARIAIARTGHLIFSAM